MSATDRFTFPGHAGDDLAARLDLPDGPVRATALFAHCFTCGKDIAAARRIAARLTAEGLAVLRFDVTGLGHSGGEFANTTFSTNAGDVAAAARALVDRGMPPGLLIGHSLGGAAVLAAAAEVPSARAVAVIGAPFDPGHVTHNFAGALDAIAADGSAEVVLGGQRLRIGRGFVADVAAARLAPAIAGLRRALLVLHAPGDTVVGIDNATRIFTAAKHPKSFVSLDTADHLVTDPADADYAAGVIAAWATRYLAFDLAPEPSHPGAPDGVVRVQDSGPEGLLQDVAVGPRHRLQVDEPASAGGTDRGPTPYDLLGAALGACTAMTLRIYARRKGLTLDHVAVEVTHDRVHADDADSTGDARIDVFRRVVRIEGDLSPEDRARLMDIADRCPVHRTLTAGARIETVRSDH